MTVMLDLAAPALKNGLRSRWLDGDEHAVEQLLLVNRADEGKKRSGTRIRFVLRRA